MLVVKLNILCRINAACGHTHKVFGFVINPAQLAMLQHYLTFSSPPQNRSWKVTRSPTSETCLISTCRLSLLRTSSTERAFLSHWTVSSTCPLLTALTTTLDWRTMKASASCLTVTLVTWHKFWGTVRWSGSSIQDFLYYLLKWGWKSINVHQKPRPGVVGTIYCAIICLQPPKYFPDYKVAKSPTN